MNTENKRTYMLLAFVVAFIISMVLVFILGETKSSKILKDVKEYINSSEPKAVYLMKDDCGYCEKNKGNIESLEKEYGYKYFEVNTNDLTKKDSDELLSILNINSDDFGTPYLVVTREGKAVDSIVGLQAYDKLFNFLQKNELISSDAKLYLNYPDFEEYKKILKSKENKVIVLATSYCQYCLAEHPELIEIAKETGAEINYVYLDSLITTQEISDEFNKSLKWFEDNTNWGTPTTLIVNNKEVKAYLSGYRAKSDVVEFYKDNGIIK